MLRETKINFTDYLIYIIYDTRNFIKLLIHSYRFFVSINKIYFKDHIKDTRGKSNFIYYTIYQI